MEKVCLSLGIFKIKFQLQLIDLKQKTIGSLFQPSGKCFCSLCLDELIRILIGSKINYPG